MSNVNKHQRKDPLLDEFLVRLILTTLMISGSYIYLIRPISSDFKTSVTVDDQPQMAKNQKSSSKGKRPKKLDERSRQKKTNLVETRYQVRDSTVSKNLIKNASASLPIPDVTEGVDEAIKLVDTGQWQEAEKKLMSLIAHHPDNEAVLMELAMLNLLDKSDADAALPYMKKVLTINAENESMVTELLAIYHEQDNSSEAVDFLKNLAKDNPDSPALDYGLGQAMMNAGMKEESIEYLERSVEAKSGWEKDEVLEQLGDTYAELGQSDEAMETYRRVIDRRKREIEQGGDRKDFYKEQYTNIRLKFASELLKRGDLGEARKVLNELESELPAGDEWLSSLQEVYRSKTL